MWSARWITVLPGDAKLYKWTQAAINSGYRGQLREEFKYPDIRARRATYGTRKSPVWKRGLLHQLSDCHTPRLSFFPCARC
jgi:hypothetical protein